ncbi:hypothetical protein GLOIN_2v1571918 [Rhizophagus clarus]|uniref:Myb/SANT-like DNA-binding domain-containing protein n=1 Tax=Rhizophagus clarus TaxID=94130 RepID=A0A8H3LFQ9_9GLOM|nr:hypothetical protein GLOIN_2v1571918 [Rhizophagus clarus]
MSSSTEWSDAQLRLLINERKQKNAEYHATPNKKKQDFWDDVASKLNEQENTNFFLGKDCHNKFLNLTKAFNTAKRYREGTGTKKSLVGKKYTKSSQRGSGLNQNFHLSKPKGKSSSVTEQPLEKAVKKSPAIGASGKSSSLTTSNPVETPNISRPITPTLPSFSQNANVINVTFNYGGVQTEED